MKKFWYIIYLIFGKTIGKFWVFAAIPFRAYACSVVFNYVLQNDLPFKRLRERNPAWDSLGKGWKLEDIHGLSNEPQKLTGWIAYRPVNKLQYYLVVFFIFGWLDPDSNHDTTDAGYIKTLLSGERKSWHRVFNKWLRKIDLDGIIYGNALDLGDVRAQYPFYNLAATFVWTDRNSAMGFQYLFFGY